VELAQSQSGANPLQTTPATARIEAQQLGKARRIRARALSPLKLRVKIIIMSILRMICVLWAI
jgi:hypothetical protein